MNYQNTENKITRKEALNKLGKYGKYVTLTSLGIFTILTPRKAQAQSPEDPGNNF